MDITYPPEMLPSPDEGDDVEIVVVEPSEGATERLLDILSDIKDQADDLVELILDGDDVGVLTSFDEKDGLVHKPIKHRDFYKTH